MSRQTQAEKYCNNFFFISNFVFYENYLINFFVLWVITTKYNNINPLTFFLHTEHKVSTKHYGDKRIT